MTGLVPATGLLPLPRSLVLDIAKAIERGFLRSSNPEVVSFLPQLVLAHADTIIADPNSRNILAVIYT
jgi:hypothetical protein